MRVSMVEGVIFGIAVLGAGLEIINTVAAILRNRVSLKVRCGSAHSRHLG